MIKLITKNRTLNVISHEVQSVGTVVLITEQSGAVVVSKENQHDVWQAMIDADMDMSISQSVLDRRPIQEWSASMIASDEKLPRWAEDIIDGIISDETKKLVADKKALRLTKP